MQVSVRILGGLMALGYEIGTIMKRTSIIHTDDRLTIKLDTIEGMGRSFVQVPIACAHLALCTERTMEIMTFLLNNCWEEKSRLLFQLF